MSEEALYQQYLIISCRGSINPLSMYYSYIVFQKVQLHYFQNLCILVFYTHSNSVSKLQSLSSLIQTLHSNSVQARARCKTLVTETQTCPAPALYLVLLYDNQHCSTNSIKQGQIASQWVKYLDMAIPLSIGEEQNYGDFPCLNNFADSFQGIIITELHVKTPHQNTEPS